MEKIKNTHLKKYTKPTITKHIVHLENSISAMSTNINPTDNNNQITVEDWESGQDISNDLTW